MSDGQMALFHDDAEAPKTPWDLLDRAPPPQLVEHLDRHRHGGRDLHRGDGPARLLRALVRAGLGEEYLAAAAMLVLELDAKAGR
jgi:hypothetical protein